MGYCCSPSRIRKKKITQLDAATEAALDDLFETVQYDDVSGEFKSRKQTVQLLANLIATIIEPGEGGTVTPNLNGDVDPEGVVTAVRNVLYRNDEEQTYWWKTTAIGNTGWTQL